MLSNPKYGENMTTLILMSRLGKRLSGSEKENPK